ncbi:MAG: hypothetical protein ACI4RU_03055 [Acutalibacteraceae bacterium]
MKNFKKLTAVMLIFALVFSFIFPVFAGEGRTFVITSPYDGVDFCSVSQYKTALHTHTNASDGDSTLFDSIERHVQTGFDIVAVTDHGTVNYSFSEENPNEFIHGLLSAFGRSEGELKYLGQSGTFSDGTQYEMLTKENGDDYLMLSGGREILRIPYGIENNAVSVNAHVNSWFVDYHDNSVTTYEDAVSGVDKLGGVCVINHPGEYTKARYELHSEDAYNVSTPSYNYYVNKFASLIDTYDACIGIDINSKKDNRTRFDRVLWDELLTRFSRNGENVYAIASSDAHQLEIIDTGFVYLLMNEKTSAEAENALKNGAIFPASHCIGNPEELSEIAASLYEFYGETELYKKVNDTVLAMKERINSIEKGSEKADEDIGIVYSVLDDNGFCTAETQPMITNIKTSGDTITVDTENAEIVRFISNGKTICTKKAGEAEISLSDYADKVGDYVRAEVFGEGGIVYTEAFLINAAEKTEKTPVTNGLYFDVGFLDFLFAELHTFAKTVKIFFGKLSTSC